MSRVNVIFPGEKVSFLKSSKPSRRLQPYVDYYYEVFLQNPHNKVTWHTSLPALTDLFCVNLDGPGWGYIDSGQEQLIKKSYLIGHPSEVRENKHFKGMHNFFVAFKPGFASALLKTPNVELMDLAVDLKYLLKDPDLEERLADCQDFEERIRNFESYLYLKIQKLNLDHRYFFVQQVLDKFNHTTEVGTSNFQAIGHQVGISYPTMYRYFKEVIGFSPKYCEKLKKFKLGLERYKREGYNFNHWEFGFTDFSHFVKVSKNITGRIPSQL